MFTVKNGFMDFMFMGQCGHLVLERFLAAVVKEATEKIPLLLLSKNQEHQSAGSQSATELVTTKSIRCHATPVFTVLP